MISSMRGSAAGRLPICASARVWPPHRPLWRHGFPSLPRLRPARWTGLRTPVAGRHYCSDQWRNYGLSSVSFSDRLPCRAWFSSAIRCSCRRVISVSAATVSINARTAARCAAGMVERSMDGVADMPDFYQKSPVKTRKINQMIHSAAAGGRVSSALTLRHLRRENSPPDCFLILLSRQTAPRTAPDSASRRRSGSSARQRSFLQGACRPSPAHSSGKQSPGLFPDPPHHPRTGSSACQPVVSVRLSRSDGVMECLLDVHQR